MGFTGAEEDFVLRIMGFPMILHFDEEGFLFGIRFY